MDRFSREVVGWTLSLRARATEARAVLEAAIRERFPVGVRGRGLKVASDNGSAFLSEHFQAFARNCTGNGPSPRSSRGPRLPWPMS